MRSTTTLPRTVFDQEVEEQLDHDDTYYADWFCISTNPFPCPADGCGFVANHLTAAHRIVVWAERDDTRLLALAGQMQRYGRNPKVVTYEVALGPCISYYEWEAIGRPVHATAWKPGHVTPPPLRP